MPIARMFTTQEAAMQAVADLTAARCRNERMHVVSGSADAASLVELGIRRASAPDYAARIAAGGTLVIVDAPFGAARLAMQVLGRARGGEAGPVAPADESVGPDPAAPLSRVFHIPVLSHNPAPLSSAFGLPVLSRRTTPRAAAPVRARWPAPLSALLRMPTLSHEAAPLSALLHWATLSGKAAPLSSWLGLRLLSKDPAPLSSAIGFSVLSDPPHRRRPTR